MRSPYIRYLRRSCYRSLLVFGPGMGSGMGQCVWLSRRRDCEHRCLESLRFGEEPDARHLAAVYSGWLLVGSRQFVAALDSLDRGDVWGAAWQCSHRHSSRMYFLYDVYRCFRGDDSCFGRIAFSYPKIFGIQRSFECWTSNGSGFAWSALSSLSTVDPLHGNRVFGSCEHFSTRDIFRGCHSWGSIGRHVDCVGRDETAESSSRGSRT